MAHDVTFTNNKVASAISTEQLYQSKVNSVGSVSLTDTDFAYSGTKDGAAVNATSGRGLFSERPANPT